MKDCIFHDKYYIAMEAIEEYCKFSMHERRLPIVKNQGLNVYLQIPEVNCVSLFLMDEETYEFNHENTVPDNEAEHCAFIFQKLVDMGIIGNALRNVSISYESKDFTLLDNGYFLAIPLLKADGVIGIIILKVECPPNQLEQTFFMICNIQTGLFAFTLENVLLHLKQFEHLETLEQMVASRTINLVESKKKLADKFEDLQSNLSMTLPHEFRTPINQIIGTVDFLMKHYETVNYEEVREILQDAKDSADRLRRLTENYLFYANLSLISSDMLEILNLQKYITTSVNDIINQKAITISERYDRTEDIEILIEDAPIRMSEEYFNKIIEELLDNAFKYSDKGSFVRIACRNVGDNLEIEVSDKGRGLTEEQIKQVDAYMQFERKVYEQQGAGLGLSIVLRLLDLHNGDFYIDSKFDSGTSIIIKIPLAMEYMN